MRHLRYLRGYGRALRQHHAEVTTTAGVILAIAALAALAMRRAEPGVFSSYWEAFYWAITTITTVGYGDFVPVTTAGQVIVVLTSLVGAGFLVITAGVLAAWFVRSME